MGNPLPPGEGALELHTAIDWIAYTDFSADIDLLTASTRPGCCREVTILSAAVGSTLELRNSAGTKRPVTVTSAMIGLPLALGASMITAATTVTSLLVVW
jgi:hypothetical protein